MSNHSSQRIAIKTYGCRSNYADSVELQASMLERGSEPCELRLSEESEIPDVLVINTCTVTDTADREALRLIRKVKALRPKVKVVVTGCMAEVGSEELSSLVGEENIVGPGRRKEVLAAIYGEGGEREQDSEIDVPLQAVYQSGRRAKKALPKRRSISLSAPMSKAVPGPGAMMGEIRNRSRFHLRVQEGCENSCTFCIIPQTRGRLSSRALRDVQADVRHLRDAGYQEVVLTGTHLGGYGEDIGLNLKDLLEAVQSVEKAPRIRLSSIDPNDLTPEIIDYIAKSHQICRHLHICVQALSDRTLKRMNRKYRLDEAREILWYVEKTIPGICIGSDVIVGFPGESRQEVEEGIEEFLRLPISYLHVFPYSERSGTAATRLDGSVAIPERKRRAARWRAVAERKRNSFLQGLCGQELEVILEQEKGAHVFGTSAEFASVQISRDSLPQNWQAGQLVRAVAQHLNKDSGVLECH